MIDQKSMNKPFFFSAMNYAALGVALHYCFFSFFECTTFKFAYDDVFKTITYALLVICGTIKLLTGIWYDGQQTQDQKANRLLLIKEILALATIIPCVILTEQFKYAFLLYLPFAAFCFYGNDIRIVLRILVSCISVLFTATILCALSGAIPNLLYIRGEDGSIIRGAYGICYPTDCAAYSIYLFLFLWATQKETNWVSTILFAATALLLTLGISVYPNSRTSAICGIVIIFVIIYKRLSETVLLRQKLTTGITRIVNIFITGAFPIAGSCMFVLTWLYGNGNAFAQRADQWMSGRLGLTWNALQQYGINAFGALTPQSGWGGTNFYDEGRTYEFLDSSYALLLIRYGWIVFLIVAFLWIWMTRKAIKTGHQAIALALAVIAFHSFSEHHILDFSFNLMIAMPLCAFPCIERQPKTKRATKNEIAGWIAGGITALIFILLLPKALSWMRSLVMLNNWMRLDNNRGNNSPAALLCWLLILGGALSLWFALREMVKGLIEKRRIQWYAPVAIMTLAVIAFAGGALANKRITDGAADYQQRLVSDQTAIKAVIDSAEEPVYAGQAEELYKRFFGRIRDRILTPEELARSRKGSIILEHDNEGYLLLSTGALYAELSDYSGLYTYDESVVHRLTDEGYRFNTFFSAERNADMEELARLNDVELTTTGALLLIGEEKSLRCGPYLEQYAGNYIVSYSLHLISIKAKEDPVCLLRVSSDFGNHTRAKKEITAGDFDENGNLTISLYYSVEDVKGIEYKVYVNDDTEIAVDSVSWKRDS